VVAKKLILLMCLWLPLSGCIPVAMVAGATIGGAIIYDKRSFKTITKDNQAAIKATKRIRNQNNLRGKAQVKVSVFNGIGLVVGSATSKQEREEIGELVATTPNIRRVYNEVVISDTINSAANLSDAWLASRVRTCLLLKPGLQSSNIKIITEGGVVYLMGMLSQKQARLAANATSQISGVKKVVKVFEYD
jgi:osmotically-inducible protein OsmY